jgi:hypothetical protein
MSNCTDYTHYKICYKYYNEHTTNKLNYETAITILCEDEHTSKVEALLEDAIKIMRRTVNGYTPKDEHQNSFTTRVNSMMTNNLLFEILKVFTMIYKPNKEKLNNLIKSESLEDLNAVEKFVKDIVSNLSIKVSNKASGGSCFGWFCRINNVNKEVVSPIKKNSVVSPIKANVKNYLKQESKLKEEIAEFFRYEPNLLGRIAMIGKIGNSITPINSKPKEILNNSNVKHTPADNIAMNGKISNSITPINSKPKEISNSFSVKHTAADKIAMFEKISNLISQREEAKLPVVPAGGGFIGLPVLANSRVTTGVRPSVRYPHETQHLTSRGVPGNTSTPVQNMNYNVNTGVNMSFTSTPTTIRVANSVKQSTPIAFNTNISNIHIEQQAYSPHEFELMNEIKDRIKNLINIYEFLTKPVNTSLIVGELLLIDSNIVVEDIQEGDAIVSNFVNGQTGGGINLNKTDMITELYTLDVKTAKYEQMIAYRTYALYTTTIATSQQGGGLGDFLTNIHNKFALYSFSEKVNALQSLGKSLIVYVFKRVLQKLKIPDKIAELSVVEDADAYFELIGEYIDDIYNKGSIIKRKYDIYTKYEQNERQRQNTQMNIDIIDGLVGFATLVNIFRDSSFENTQTTSDMLSNVDFLIENLQKLKDALRNNNRSFIRDIKQKFQNFLDEVNPKMTSAEEYTSYKNNEDIKKSLEANLRGFEAYDQAIKEGKNSDKYLQIRENFKNKLGKDYNQFAKEDAEAMEAIDLSQQLLIRIAKNFTAKLLTEAELNQLKEAGSKAIEGVMSTGFVRESLESIKTGFANFLSSVSWINSSIYILKILAPLAFAFKMIAGVINAHVIYILVINLCIVALHYSVRLSIFFWRKYAKKDDFNTAEFLQELKERTGGKQRGGKTIRFVSAKSKARSSKHTLKGAGLLPPLLHPKSSIQKVHETTESSLPPIQGVKLPLIQKPMVSSNQVNDDADVDILSKIANTIVYDISKYSQATQNSYNLTPSDISEMSSALEKLITSDTVDINEIYSQHQLGGKRKHTTKNSTKKLTSLQSKTKTELLAHAKLKGVKVKSTDKKDDIIKAISIRRSKK